MWKLNWGFNEWCTITTIFFSVVAIIIAIWSSRSTSKAAEKQIREIKNLSALQVDVTIKQIEAEIQKMMAEVKNMHTPHLHFPKRILYFVKSLKQQL